ncbi:MAG: hypothetical protein EZS28_009938 [Streblomastix strix]|uniref:Uncharacterized protein n=1 Tax=Streblomastix strix TaxID=222440 RepID=A0A5J4WJP4_9EUKA|nr:MAG: hypothetical protein EZS28_009938 [Streblomastix strix]
MNYRGFKFKDKIYRNIWKPFEHYSNVGKICSLNIEKDNAVAAFNIRRGAAATALVKSTYRILQEAERMKVQLTSPFVLRKENQVADSLSRLEISGDYKINTTKLSESLKLLQIQPSIDVFENRKNVQCRKFYFLIADSSAIKKDGLTISWNKEIPQIHPPNPLILRSLNKLDNEVVIAVFIHRRRTAQASWTDLQKMMIQNTILRLCQELIEAEGRITKKRRHSSKGQLKISMQERWKDQLLFKLILQEKEEQMKQALKKAINSWPSI